MKVSDALKCFKDYLGERKRFNPNSIKLYIYDVRKLLDTAKISEKLSANNMGGITKANVRKYMSSGNSSVNTQRRRWSTAAKFFEYCMSEEIIGENPAYKVKLPKMEYKRPDFITEEEFNIVIESISISPVSFSKIRDISILSTFFNEGLRLREIEAMKYVDLIVRKGVRKVKVYRTKGGIEIPITTDTFHRMRTYENAFSERFKMNISETKHGKYYVNTDGLPLDSRSVTRDIYPLGDFLERDVGVNPSTIRYGFMRMLIYQDLPFKEIVERAGTSISTVRRLAECCSLQDIPG